MVEFLLFLIFISVASLTLSISAHKRQSRINAEAIANEIRFLTNHNNQQ